MPSASVRVHSGSAASMQSPEPERFFREPQVSVDDDVQVMVVRYSRQGRTPAGSVFTQTLELTVQFSPRAAASSSSFRQAESSSVTSPGVVSTSSVMMSSPMTSSRVQR